MTSDQTLNAARKAWLADNHDEALDLFRSAYEQSPNDLRLAIEFASYLGMRFEIDEAVTVLQRCESAAGENPRVWHQLGLAYQRAYRPEGAIRCFEESTREKTHIQPALKIVEWYERRGRMSEAREVLAKLPSEVPQVQLWRAKLEHRNGVLDAAADTLRNLTSDSVDTETRISAFYSLAEVLDQQDRAEEAIAAATEAKLLQLPMARQQLAIAKSLQPIEQNFVSSVSREHFERWDGMHPPTALLTGLPRSGTSLMCRMLGMQTQLAVADEIEAYPTYLQRRMLAGQSGTSAAAVLDAIDESKVVACRMLYRRWLSSALDRDVMEQPLLDKFPSTTFLITPFRRLFPLAVVVVAIRDPRDVVVSCFLRNLAMNPVSAQFNRLETTVARCIAESRAWLALREKLTPPWHEVRYEDVVAGGYQGLAATLDSLGLKWDDRFADFRESLHVSPVRSPTYAQLRQPITQNRTRRWELYRAFLGPHLEALSELARELGYAS